MSRFALDGQSKKLELSAGIVVTVPAVVGVLAEVEGRERAFGAAAFDAMLEAAGLERHKQIELELAPQPIAARAFAAATPRLELDIEPPEGKAALVLVEDESGALSWHVPTPPAAGARALVSTQHFSIPVVQREAPQQGARFFGKLFKKILKVFVYPITDFIVGALGKPVVRAWESSHRPYQLRAYTSNVYRHERSQVPSLGQEDWRRLNGKRALLFLHGTFSSCDAFRELPQATIAALEQQYGQRVIAFNHPTLGEDPLANVERLQELIPSDVKIELDVIAHSRGGLVARQLAASGGARLRVGKVVLVGVPNRGTKLADADHIVSLIDRYTTLTKLLPGTVGTVLDAVVFVVKALAHGLISQLDGLRSMDPAGAFLKRLSEQHAFSSADYYAIGSDYEPKAGTPLFNIARLADAAADDAFGQAGNDLVVPTKGSLQLTATAEVPAAKVFTFKQSDAVIHTDYFSHGATSTQLTGWLTGSGKPGTRGLARPRGERLAPDMLQALRPHVINLSEGTFARSGQYVTTQSDVDAVFRQIEAWAATQQERPKLMFWAHGGLIGEQAGLQIAHKHVAFWKKNGVYPIYFVWETGIMTALKSVAKAVENKLFGLGKRDLREAVSDPVIERACRALGGVQLWGAMKQNAERASLPGGGAYYVAERLAELRRKKPELEVHAAGHSAGSIFHAHFLPAAAKLGAGTIQSLHLLAPAVRVDTFNRTLAPMIGNGIAHTTMYTMHRDYELDDACFGIYGKSLLYLIHHALEPAALEAILGLEMSVRDDDVAARALGLSVSSPAAEVIWSRTEDDSGRSASQSTTHGGFDDDAPTMGSIAARVLALEAPIFAYPEQSLQRELSAEDEWLAGVDTSGWGEPGVAAPAPAPAPAPAAPLPSLPPPPAAASSTLVTGPTVANDNLPLTAAGTGRRFALCVGIDDYKGPSRLEGPVNDATKWAEFLRGQSFEVTTLFDGQATYHGITDTLQRILQSARAGDSVVFQFAGHGYYVPDEDGDEPSGQDQTLVPHDYEVGGFVIDDDLRALLLAAPSGVAVTCFMDCCHSGSNTRLLGGPAQQPRGKRRLLQVSEEQRRELVDAHQRFRAELRRNAPARGRSFNAGAMRWVSFAACQDHESAFEHNGSGDFTRIALGVLSQSPALRHSELYERIQQGFGPQRAQTPLLDCAPELKDRLLFVAS